MREFYFNVSDRQRRRRLKIAKLKELYLGKKKKLPFGSNNPFLVELQKLKSTIPEWENFFSAPADLRGNNWVRLEVLAQPLCDKYAWAVPDARSLRIITHYSPLVEIGVGIE